MSGYLSGFVYSTAFLFILMFLEYITRKNNLNKELTRKIAHVLSSLFGALMGIILKPSVFITFVFFFLAIISVSYGIRFFTSIHNVKRKTYGEIFLPLGILTAYLLSNSSVVNYLASVLILAISDPLAGIIGDISNKKILYRSLAFFISSLVIILMIFNFKPLITAIFVALLITIVEGLSAYGTDNLTVPIASSLLFKLMF